MAGVEGFEPSLVGPKPTALDQAKLHPNKKGAPYQRRQHAPPVVYAPVEATFGFSRLIVNPVS
jgi:hypothetical protein